jgi:hypothetical protein
MPTTVLSAVSVRGTNGTMGTARLEVDWNTNNRRVTAARVVSTIDRTVVARLSSPLIPEGAYVVTVPANGTVARNIPAGAGLTWGTPNPDPGGEGSQVLDSAGVQAPYGFTAN